MEVTIPSAFATGAPLSPEELASAPIRRPAPSTLSTPLELEGAKARSGARTLGLESVGDLLEHLPRDRREARRIADLVDSETASIVVTVRSITTRPVRKRGMKPLVTATVFDPSGSLRVTFFNQPWLTQRYGAGTRLVLHGKFDERRGFTVQGHAVTGDVAGFAGTPAAPVGAPGGGAPDGGAPEDGAPGGGAPDGGATGDGGAPEGGGSKKRAVGAQIRPTPESLAHIRPILATQAASLAHYPATEGLSSTQILALVQRHAASCDDVVEPLPTRIRRRERLLSRPEALRAAHFPRSDGDVAAARRRLAFDELLYGQLTLAQRRRARAQSATAPVLDQAPELTARWLADGLPFTPTGDQVNAVAAIDADLARREPMHRLLMGDVGTGKTVVALYAMLRAVEHGYQAAMMAPTETLAEQHFATIQRLLGAQLIQAGLLTGSTPGGRRGELLARLASGELGLIVGTHALIEDSVGFSRLGVVVVDEQHRFGVEQRAALDLKGPAGQSPHVLHMTATPIPRTLALTNYGDLDFTVLSELPRGRQPIQTEVCSSEAERSRAYERIREQLRAGRQAFVVCPLVEESDALQARAATAEYERLRTGELKDFRVVLMHGQMRPAEKAAAMAQFAEGAADVLVATTVIEVGIDVPNATVMLVEDADRYGISQLHQLRGRIGRGEHASACILFGAKGSVRLQALAREADGFRLAEIDLGLRGEGELTGLRQSGAAVFRFAVFPDDAELLERAGRYAREVIDADPDLTAPDHALLAHVLTARFGAETAAPIRA